jgi:hypothetical protein
MDGAPLAACSMGSDAHPLLSPPTTASCERADGGEAESEPRRSIDELIGDAVEQHAREIVPSIRAAYQYHHARPQLCAGESAAKSVRMLRELWSHIA